MTNLPDPNAAAKAGYHEFRSFDGDATSFEVVWFDDFHVDEYQPGWYWVFGLPGCLWDGEPIGPFDCSTSAYHNCVEELIESATH